MHALLLAPGEPPRGEGACGCHLACDQGAATAYLEAQLDLVYVARLAHDAGLTVTELDTAWLRTTPEEAVVQARVDELDEAARSEKLNSEVVKILDALRSNGYEPHLRIEDITIEGGGDIPVWASDGDDSRRGGPASG